MSTPDDDQRFFLLTLPGRLERLEEAELQRSTLYRRLHRAEQRVMALAECLGFIFVFSLCGGIAAYIYFSRAMSVWEWGALAAIFVLCDYFFVRAWRHFRKD